MTGILLATALPNRQLIYWRSGVRLAAALVAAIATGLWMAYAGGSPAFWLTGTVLLTALTIALVLAGAVPLRFLTRRFELYEDGFEVHDQQVTIEQIEHLYWRRRMFRLFGCIATDRSYLELTCLLKPTHPKQKKGHKLRYSELIYLDLYDCFEEAYEQSIPATYSLTLRPAMPVAAPSESGAPPEQENKAE